MKTPCFIFPALCIACILLLGSCKKKNEASPNTSVTYHFEVDFNANTVDISKVDSATISLNVGDQIIVKKLQKGTGLYSIDNVSLSSSPTGVSVSVYGPVDPTGQGGSSSGTIFLYDITGSDTFKLIGPSDVKKDNWKRRPVVVDNVHHVQLTFGENPDDPYFSIKADNPTIWTEMSILRDANNNSIGLGGSPNFTIPPFANGTNIITNTTTFAAYATSMHNQSWTSGAILLNMGYSGNAYVVQLYYQYDSRN
jgi:hypothetical protein